jgi:hypothetical protein
MTTASSFRRSERFGFPAPRWSFAGKSIVVQMADAAT